MMFCPGFTVVEVPKNASTSLRRALEPYQLPDCQLPGPRPARHATFEAIQDWELGHCIGVVRNPFERMVSMWRYCQRKRAEVSKMGFADFVADYVWMEHSTGDRIPITHTPQSVWLTSCDTVIRFERLHLDAFGVFALQGVRLKALPVKNAAPIGGDWRDEYTTKLRDTVHERFALDFQKWRYVFND
jgi:hypothetical protein